MSADDQLWPLRTSDLDESALECAGTCVGAGTWLALKSPALYSCTCSVECFREQHRPHFVGQYDQWNPSATRRSSSRTQQANCIRGRPRLTHDRDGRQ
jgi:hypothetical protein